MASTASATGVIALVATAALWGSNHVVARAVRDMVPLPSLVFWRWFIGASLLTLIALPALRRAWPQLRDLKADLILWGIVGVGLFSYLLLGGAYYSLALEVGLINATTPIWTAALGALFGTERLSRRALAGLALALAGTLVIALKGDPAALGRLQFGYGNILSLLAAITFAAFSLRVRVWSKSIDPLSMTVATAWSGILLVMLPVYCVAGVLTGHWFVQPGADLTLSAAAVGYMALGPTMTGNLLYLYGVGVTGPTRAATFLYLSPVFSAGLAILVLGERLAWFHLVGVAVIAAGLWLLVATPAARPEPR
ncbi:MAG: DMT family transporter [Phreatobacter sp.]|jgi:drug/metabolite transporter (DMT)-like permease|uniref:DMT family transporter n=1 Tax=Phreatobacter sp. TaxID=1966341 RepID=UPI004036D74C